MQPRFVAAQPRPDRLRESRLAAYVEMLHLPPIVVVLSAAAVLTSAASYPPSAWRLALFLGSLLVSQLAISVHNDYCDRQLDAEVKPWRAFPRALITPAQALAVVALLLLTAVALAAPLGVAVVALGVLGTVCGLAYNAGLKRTLWVWVPFWIALPTLAVAAFVVADEYSPRVLPAYGVGLPLAVAVYLTDTIGDAVTDREAGVRSLTAALGARRSRLVAWASLLAAGVTAALAFADSDTLPLFAIPLAVLAAAVAASSRAPRLHWPLMMAGVVAVAAVSAVALAG